MPDLRGAPPGAAPASEPVTYLDASFEELYPEFLWRKSMSQGEKAAQWGKIRGRWVRWEGVIASFTNKGVTMKHLLTTVTFDVSLICEQSVIPKLKQRFAVGDRVRYVGRLDSFDDIFRTMYLQHGVVLEKLAHSDLGVIADMAHPVPTP
jgi:hypothetical protein